MTAAGLPHSGTPGSQPACGSPGTIAACRALLRLSVPRHPPCALSSLGRIFSGPTRKPAYPVSGTDAHVRHTIGADLPSTLPHTRVVNQTGIPRSALRWFSPRSGTRAVGFESFRPGAAMLESTRPGLLAALKEVIQPQVPLRLPCYDFAPVTELAFGGSLPQAGWVTDFGRSRLPWRDGRCVQGPGTYSPWCS